MYQVAAHHEVSVQNWKIEILGRTRDEIDHSVSTSNLKCAKSTDIRSLGEFQQFDDCLIVPDRSVQFVD